MVHYLRADMWRIYRRPMKNITWAVSMVIGIIMVWSAVNMRNFNYVVMGERITWALIFLPLLTSMINLYFVYEEDLEVKTMQIAIGNGISRPGIIFCKWAEMALLAAGDILSLLAVTNLTGLLGGTVLHGSTIGQVLAQAVDVWLGVVVMASLIMPLIYFMQQLGACQILFLVLCFRPLSMAVRLLSLTNEWLAKLRLGRFLAGECISSFESQLAIGKLDIKSLLVVFLYIAAGFLISERIFRKKELDF